MLLTMPVLIAFYCAVVDGDRAPRRAVLRLDPRPVACTIRCYITPVLHGRHDGLAAEDLAGDGGRSRSAEDDDVHARLSSPVMFLWAPAGVAVYWLMSNLWGIGQQHLTNYLIGPPNVRSVRPPAERRMKRVGGGKTEAAAREP